MQRINKYSAGDAFTLFAGHDYSSEPIRILVNFRMKKLAYVCIRALHHDGLVLFIFMHVYV